MKLLLCTLSKEKDGSISYNNVWVEFTDTNSLDTNTMRRAIDFAEFKLETQVAVLNVVKLEE